MKKNSILTIAILSAFLGLAGCSDDSKDNSSNNNENTTPECTEASVLTCASETSKNVCNSGKIEAQPCGENEICQDNTCKAKGDDTPTDKPECTDDSTLSCASETSKNVCNAGKIEAQPCGENEICQDNTCKAKGDDTPTDKPECTDDSALSCASETSKNVCKAGKIEEQACGENEICQDNTCKAKGDDTPTDKPECTDDKTLSCASETSKNVCKAGKIEEQACGENEICENNTCKAKSDTPTEPTKPVKGGDCTIDACDNNIPYYCVSGHYQVDEESGCGDKVCEVMDGRNAFCLEACTKENEVRNVCGQNQIQPYSAKAVCKKYEDGKLAVYYDEADSSAITMCDIECKDGECVNQKPVVQTDDTGKECDSSYGYTCFENKLQSCPISIVQAQVCSETCAYMDGDKPNNAYCVTDEGCTENKTEYKCSEIDENTERLLIYKCTKAHNGKFYMFGAGHKNCEYGSCKEDGSCDEQ